MGMYLTNPHLPHVRMDAVRLVRQGWTTRAVARHLGFAQGTIVKWVQRAPDDRMARIIPTRSCRPHHHPNQLPTGTVQAILEYRQRTGRGAEFLHYVLNRDGCTVSLSSVKRVLRRHGYTNHSPWKRWHRSVPRPRAETPGTLVEIDTIHSGQHNDRLYVYTLLDVCSRWAFAAATARITTHRSLRFVTRAGQVAPFPFRCLQSDHGSEFSTWLTNRLQARGMTHRYTRIRTPTDNGHLERFNRTIQEECLARLTRSLRAWQRGIPEYLHYYNTERPHLGLQMKTPLEVIPSY